MKRKIFAKKNSIKKIFTKKKFVEKNVREKKFEKNFKNNFGNSSIFEKNSVEIQLIFLFLKKKVGYSRLIHQSKDRKLSVNLD